MNILHLEDNVNDAELICGALREDDIPCHVTRVETRKAFLEALDRGDWDIILADYLLPSFDGISALKLATVRCPEVPFIFVTGALGEELAVESLKNGATDYVLKHGLGRLPQSLARARREGEMLKAQRESEQTIKAALREKELLLQEVHHRVKNNLQIICSLLNMQAAAVDDPNVNSALQESQTRVQSMAMIHEMLYDSSSLDKVDFAQYARLLAGELSTCYGIDPARIRLVFDLESTPFAIDRAIPCGLILNELLSNAFKYAFPDLQSGEIRISLHQQEHCIRLAVEDNGVGLPSGGFLRETKSLGLRIINILAKQLGGNMEMSSGVGSKFVLTINKA